MNVRGCRKRKQKECSKEGSKESLKEEKRLKRRLEDCHAPVMGVTPKVLRHAHTQRVGPTVTHHHLAHPRPHVVDTELRRCDVRLRGRRGGGRRSEGGGGEG